MGEGLRRVLVDIGEVLERAFSLLHALRESLGRHWLVPLWRPSRPRPAMDAREGPDRRRRRRSRGRRREGLEGRRRRNSRNCGVGGGTVEGHGLRLEGLWEGPEPAGRGRGPGGGPRREEGYSRTEDLRRSNGQEALEGPNGRKQPPLPRGTKECLSIGETSSHIFASPPAPLLLDARTSMRGPSPPHPPLLTSMRGPLTSHL